MSPHLPNDAIIAVGMLLHHIPTAITFRVLCNCPQSSPRHHTQRGIQGNKPHYRYPTADEIAAATGTRRQSPPIDTPAPRR